jgi:hypothetical protein
MTKKQIIEDYESGIFHPGFAGFYCKELDKHVVRRLPLKEEEKEIVLSAFKEDNVPPDRYAISNKSSGAVIKRTLTKRVHDARISVHNIPIKNQRRWMFCKVILFSN